MKPRTGGRKRSQKRGEPFNLLSGLDVEQTCPEPEVLGPPPPRARATALSLLEQALSGKPNWRSCPWGISRASAVSFRSVNDMSRAFLHPCDACEFLRCTDWKKRACQAREKGETCGRPALLLPSLLPPPPFLSTFFLQGSGVAMRTGSLWGSLGPPCW